MQTFIFGLLLACVSGVTVVAFKHPNGFAKLFPYMFAGATALLIGVTVWHVAVEVTWTTLRQYMVEETLPEAATTTGQLRPPFAWVGLWYLVVVAFLWVNLKLPPFLQNANEHGTPMDKENPH